MCHQSVRSFVEKCLPPGKIASKRILEVGSLNINGTIRDYISKYFPAEYTGIDIQSGPDVDLVLDITRLFSKFKENYFDIILCLSTLEHIRYIKKSITIIKQALTPGGLLVLSTCSPGFPEHNFPHDYWRFSISDIRFLFSDLTILNLLPDPQIAGIHLFAAKPSSSFIFLPKDLSKFKIASV